VANVLFKTENRKIKVGKKDAGFWIVDDTG
jgi:hypothetical protein